MGFVTVTGVEEMAGAMRAARVELRTDFAAAKKVGAERLTGAVQAAWPKPTGRMAQTFKPFVTQSTAGTRSMHPGAAVVEFATEYRRRIPGSGNVAQVHVTAGPNPPRYAFNVRDRLSDEVIGLADAALRKTLSLKGILEEG